MFVFSGVEGACLSSPMLESRAILANHTSFFLLNNKTRRRYDTKHTNTQWYKTFPQYCTYASTGWPKLCDTTLHFCL